MFQAMSQCQALHPDPEAQEDIEDEEEELENEENEGGMYDDTEEDHEPDSNGDGNGVAPMDEN